MRDSAVVERLKGQLLKPLTGSIEQTKQLINGEVTRATELLRSINYQPE